jgi:hypothetical protein
VKRSPSYVETEEWDTNKKQNGAVKYFHIWDESEVENSW